MQKHNWVLTTRTAVVVTASALIVVAGCTPRRRGNVPLPDAGASLDMTTATDLGHVDLGEGIDLGEVITDDGGTVSDLGRDAGARCGNRVVDPGEACDGTNLDGETCVSQGYISGTLNCALDCTEFSTAGCVGAGTHAPMVTSFTASPSTLTPSTSITLSVDVTDADGLSDLQTPELYDNYGYMYGYLYGSSGHYTMTLDWATVNSVSTIEFTTATSTRTFEVHVSDYEGMTGTRSLNLTLSCGAAGYGACDGTCVDLNASANCGSCGHVCPSGCSAGTCVCAMGSSDCAGTCLAHTSGSCSTPANGDLGVDASSGLYVFYMGSWRGICDDGFDTADATVACRQFGRTLSTYSQSHMGPADSFWLDDIGCGGSESRIDTCSNSGWGYDNCSNYEWVSLSCVW